MVHLQGFEPAMLASLTHRPRVSCSQAEVNAQLKKNKKSHLSLMVHLQGFEPGTH